MFNIEGIFFIILLENPWMVLGGDVFNDTVDLKALFLHFLVMRSALVMCSGLDKIRHNLKDTAESLFCVSWSEFMLEVLEKDCIFEFFFLSPVSLLLISNVVFYRWFLYNEGKNGFFLDLFGFRQQIDLGLWFHVLKKLYI